MVAFSPSVHPSMNFNTLGFVISWLWQIILQWYLFTLVVSFSLKKYPEAGLLDHMVVLFLIFLRNLHTFSIMAAPVDIPTNSVGEFPFSHVLANHYFLSF